MIDLQLNDIRHKALNGRVVLTKFLDLEEQSSIIKLKNEGFYVYLSGGFLDSERKRAIIKPFDNSPNKEEYDITVLKASFDKKFADINHRHVLGTIMSLGIERNTFGDIIVKDDEIYIAASNEIKEYIISNLTSILRWPVRFSTDSSLCNLEAKGEIKNLICASLRLDAVIARAFNLSRGDASDLIIKGKAFVNYKQILSTDFHVSVDDVISVRQHGRITILEYVGKTKKMRECINVEIKH